MEEKLIEVFHDEARCKAAATCPRLTVRMHFHEPNVFTLPAWQSQGLYTSGIDRRVVFICESPSSLHVGRPPDFVVEGVGGRRTWAGVNWRTQAFLDARAEAGFQHCFITNTVKCGCPAGVRDKPNDTELRNCSGFLRREVEAIMPAVVAYVGGWASTHAQPYLRSLAVTPAPAHVLVTHYSSRLSESEKRRQWRSQFATISREIVARGLPADHPVFLRLNV